MAATPTSPRPSPKKNRVQEKEELQRLNDRLLVYIEKVKSLEESNSKLTEEITITKTWKQTEVDNVRRSCELQQAETRRQLDEAKKLNARLRIENRENAASADEYTRKFDKEVAAHKKTDDALKAAQRKLSDRESQLASLNQEAKNLEAVVQELREECHELKVTLKSAKYALEQETLSRVDLENELHSMKEENDMYKKDILETRTQLRSQESQHVKIKIEIESRFEENLAKKLQEQRDRQDTEIKQYKDEIDNLYRSKYDELQKMYAQDVEELSIIREEKRTLSMTVDNLKSENASFVLRIEDLKKLRAEDQRKADEAIASRVVQIKELLKKIDEAVKYYDYEGLTALDLEISAYEKMLEGEEERLKIPSPGRSAKRKRTEEGTKETKYSNQGYIQIEEASTDGTFVKLFNSGAKDFALGGWSVERSVDDEPPISYNFTKKYVLKTGSYVTIWASQGGRQHKPPSDLLFRNKASWGVGKETKTVLRDADGQEAASEEVKLLSKFGDEHRRLRPPIAQKRFRAQLEAATAVSEEVSIIRTDETDNQPGEKKGICTIQ